MAVLPLYQLPRPVDPFLPIPVSFWYPAPRELFTVAIPAHQDSKGFQPQHPPQNTQASFLSSAQTLSSSQLYGSQVSASSSAPAPVPTFPGHLQQIPSVQTNPTRTHNVPPSSSPEKSLVPPYSSSVTDTNMQQGQYDTNYDPNVTRPAPAHGYSGQQPQSYGQTNMTPPAQPQMPQPMPSVSMQPTPAPGMDIRNVKGMPRDAIGEREWSHAWSDCFDDCGTCMLGWCCPCVLYSQIQTRVNHLETRGTPHPTGGDSCASDCFVHGLLTCCGGWGWILQMGQRSAVRTRYRIAGDGCSDCMLSWCCTPCEMTQASREVELEECSFSGAPVVQPPPPTTSSNAYPEKH